MFLKSQLLEHRILQKDSPLMIHGIASNQHTTVECVNLDMCIPGRYDTDGRHVEALLKRQAFVVEDLWAKMLVGMDVIAAKEVNLIISTHTGHIGSCCTTLEHLVTLSLRAFIKQRVMLENPVSTPACSHMAVPVEHVELPPWRLHV